MGLTGVNFETIWPLVDDTSKIARFRGILNAEEG